MNCQEVPTSAKAPSTARFSDSLAHPPRESTMAASHASARAWHERGTNGRVTRGGPTYRLGLLALQREPAESVFLHGPCRLLRHRTTLSRIATSVVVVPFSPGQSCRPSIASTMSHSVAWSERPVRMPPE